VKKHPCISDQEICSNFLLEIEISANFQTKGTLIMVFFLSLFAAMVHFYLQYEKNSRGEKNGETHSQPTMVEV
jgi:hypothetical protein